MRLQSFVLLALPRLSSAILAIFLSACAWAQTEITVASGSTALVPNNRWAMVIGVSNYLPEIGPLRYTAKEAREFADTLRSELKFSDANMRLLSDGGTPEEAPSSANILTQLDSLLSDKRLDKGNLFVFYFSGHGMGTPNGDFLLPADTKKDQIEAMGVPVREVISRIVKAGLKNVLFIADACRAGTKNDFGEDLSALCRKSNIAVLLGCAPGKRSYEYATLKQGAFTHFLLEGLKKPELRDVSGALWASKLGEDVQDQVHKYTEADHGKFAQIPALWGDPTTLDVLLAAYPRPPISDAAVSAFKSKVEKLERHEYASAVSSYALELYNGDRFDEAVNLLKTVDQLGELTPRAGIILASALDNLGRTGEAEKVYTSFQSQPDGYYRDFALATGSSRDLSPTVRVEAAIRLFETDPAWNVKMMAWNVLDQWGTYDQKLTYAKKLAQIKGASQRERSYANGQVAFLLGKWADAVASFDESRKSPGEWPSDYIVCLAKLGPVLMLGDEKVLDAYLEDPTNKGRNVGFAYIERAQLAKNKGDVDGRLKFLRLALAQDLDPRFILLSAKVAGPYIGMLQEEFKSAALKHPYAWRARIVLYFIRKIQNDPTLESDAQAINRYMDDPLTFNAKLFDFMDSFMTEAIQLNRVTLDTYRSQLDLYFLLLKDSIKDFGYDADLWMQLAKYGMFNERNAQVNQVVAKHLPGKAEAAPKELRPMLLLLAMNRGDSTASERIFKATFEPTERTDPAWFYACYLATQDKPEEARKLLKGLAPPSSSIASRMDGLVTYLLAKLGPADEARKRLATTSEDVIERAWQGMAWAELGDWQKAEPLLEQQARDRDWTFLFVQEFAMRRLDAYYRKSEKADALLLAFSAMISQPGNPLFARYVFAEKPGKAQFAGSVEMDSQAVDDKDPNLKGKLKFTVTASGVFEAAFVAEDGKSIALKGAIDEYGNVTGTSEWNGRKCSLTGKIAPPALYKNFAGFSNPGQLLQLVDEEGFRIALLARTKSK